VRQLQESFEFLLNLIHTKCLPRLELLKLFFVSHLLNGGVSGSMSAVIPFVRCHVELSSPETTFAGLRNVVKSIWPEYTFLPDAEFAYKQFTDGSTLFSSFFFFF